jgi:hypothetical protein
MDFSFENGFAARKWIFHLKMDLPLENGYVRENGFAAGKWISRWKMDLSPEIGFAAGKWI